jgi:hypothetical protein
MARSGCLLLATLVLASSAAACGPRRGSTSAGGAGGAAPDDDGGPSRGDIEMNLRARMARVDGDACARQAWLKDLTLKATGLRAEVAEELLVQQGASCRRLKAPAGEPAGVASAGGGSTAPGTATPAPATAPGTATPAPGPGAADGDQAGRRTLPPETAGGACTRARAETELRARNPRHKLARDQVDAEFERCFRDRIATCQLALDAEADEGLACWKQDPWPEVPASISPEDIAKTGMCLLELKGVISDLRKCRAKLPAERDACVTPYIGYAPSCPLLKADRAWRAFPGREDIERVAKADSERRPPKDPKAEREAKLKAEREAKLKAEQEAKAAAEAAKTAKETERCFGRTTMEFADKLRTQPGPRSVPGCKYQVVGRVFSRNNEFVQVMDAESPNLYLLRTKEPFTEGDPLTDRTGAFDAIEEVEMADGTKRAFAVFKLDPAAAKPPKK